MTKEFFVDTDRDDFDGEIQFVVSEEELAADTDITEKGLTAQTLTIENGYGETTISPVAFGTYYVYEVVDKKVATTYGIYTVDGDGEKLTLDAANRTAEADLTNSRYLGNLKIKKTVEGTDYSETIFYFNITLTPPTGMSLESSYPAVHSGDATITSVSIGEGNVVSDIQLKAGQTLEINELPRGTSYIVEEINIPDGYKKTSPVDKAEGDIGIGTTNEEEFVNTYTSKGKVELGGKKILDGRYFKSGDTLTVEVYDGEVNENETANIQPLESVDVDLAQYIGKSEAPYSVPAIEYDLEDVGGLGGEKTFTYTVIEVANMAGTTKTIGRHIVDVTLKDNNEGELIITGVTIDGNTVAPEDLTTALGGLDFTNTYHTTAKKQIKANKVLKAMNLKAGDFTFTLTGSKEVVDLIGDAANQTKTNDESGDVEFDPLNFAVHPTADELEKGYVDIADLQMVNGHYEFTLTLAESEDGLAEKDIRIEDDDKKQYTITVNVDYNPGNGVLAVSINPDEESFEFTNLKNAKAEINVEAKKTMLGRPLTDGEFHFTVNGKVSDAHRNDPRYTIDQKTTNTGESVVFDNLLFAVYPTEEQEQAGYIDVTDLVVDPGTYSFDLTVAEDLAALAGNPEVVPVSPIATSGKMSYPVKITLTYDKEKGELTATRDKDAEDLVFINRIVKIQKTDLAGNELTGSHIKILDEAGTVIDEWDSRTGVLHEAANRTDPSNPISLIAGKTYKLIETATPKVDGEDNWYYKFAGEATFKIKTDGSIETSGLDIRSADGVLLLKDEIPEKPEFEKKIKDTNDSTGETSGWQDSADYDIDDEVPYRLTATMADNVTDYRNYHITFKDEMEKGLTFNGVSLVTVNGKEVPATDYELNVANDKHSFDLTLTWIGQEGAKIADESLNKAKVEVYFTAILNENAVLGNKGNVNTGKLEYSCNPSVNDSGDQSEETEETEEDSVIAFTYKVVVNKVDEGGKDALKGAQFTLEKKIKDSATNKVIVFVEANPDATFTFEGLDDGEYVLTETKTPDGYKPIDPVTFTVEAVHNQEWDVTNREQVAAKRKDVLTSLNGVYIYTDQATGEEVKSDKITGLIEFIPFELSDLSGLAMNVTNTSESTTAIIRKIWDDDDNRDRTRPAGLVVKLLADGKDTGRTAKLNAENHWADRISGIPMMSHGKKIEYTWEEPKVDGYTMKSNRSTDGILTTLTNTYEIEKVEISVKKDWVDNDNKAGVRPTSIDVQLYADNVAVGGVVTLSADNNWFHTWPELPKNVNETGVKREIKYSVNETEIPEGYIGKVTKTISREDGSKTTKISFKITNTYENGKLIIEKEFDIAPWEPFTPDDSPMDIPVIKTWNDNNNKDGNRPASVVVRLLANGTQVATAELNAGNNWRYTFAGMPRIDENKERINYTITEDPVEWYKAQINGFNIRNNYEPELTSVTVTKIWDDANNEMQARPESIVMTLSNGMTVLLNDQNNWTATINDLPTRVNGAPANYTWTEQKVLGYDKVAEVTEGSVTTFMNRRWVRPATPNRGGTPKTAGETVYEFDEYETPLGVDIVINHVGDCFD